MCYPTFVRRLGMWGARTLRLVISFSTQADMNCCWNNQQRLWRCNFNIDLLYSARSWVDSAVEWRRGTAVPFHVPRPNHSGRKKQSFFFQSQPPQRSTVTWFWSTETDDTYNSNFWNDSFYSTRNKFLVSSKLPRRNPNLKAVDYVIHGKLRDSQKTTWFTENYVIHRAPVETT